MAHEHSHATAVAGGNEKALRWALALTSTYLVAEVIGGLVSGSLALLSDAAHMATDTVALAISLAAIWLGKRPADKRRTFGYYRFEILAAVVNAVLLFFVAIYVLYEAYRRISQPAEIQSTMMLLVAIGGLVVNLIGMRLLASGKDESLNVKGAYLEVWADMLGSVGVIAGALVIRFTGWAWVDSVIAVAIGLWVLPRTWRLLRESLNVLLEGVPDEIDLPEVERALQAQPGVAGLHDLHVWALSSGKVSLSVHVVCTPDVVDLAPLMLQLRGLLAEKFDIHHSTVQVERVPCEQAGESHGFGPAVTAG
ncbi:cation transporter [Variovorax sp. KBS0712]|uniref:cation diffusion facilitator family transporter n=1 Tax=Variovorax sp. KBS0712 TaxID=2578111 RepID=UPI00111890B0|nr:cation diffusion facilitator family transporter [Variovorax sp. KBS0712]TSD59223.1 cation transporter [Variovorax sp. KBS0712]